MKREPVPDLRLGEAMEVCRPGGVDLSDLGLAFLADRLAADPELQRRFRRLQRLDESLAEAFRDVPVPEGLADRIVAQLSAQPTGSAVPRVEATTDRASVAPRLGSPAQSRAVSRRWLATGGLAFAAAAALLLAVALQAIRAAKPLDGAVLAEGAIELFCGGPAERGYALNELSPPENYPFSSDVRRSFEITWRWERGFFGRIAVAYDLAGPAGERGTLYVFIGNAVNVPDQPPLQPFVTRGASAWVWQTDQLVYVLVVEGGPRAREGFLVTPREPLT